VFFWCMAPRQRFASWQVRSSIWERKRHHVIIGDCRSRLQSQVGAETDRIFDSK
jgi:hypothetical protein